MIILEALYKMLAPTKVQKEGVTDENGEWPEEEKKKLADALENLDNSKKKIIIQNSVVNVSHELVFQGPAIDNKVIKDSKDSSYNELNIPPIALPIALPAPPDHAILSEPNPPGGVGSDTHKVIETSKKENPPEDPRTSIHRMGY